MPIYRSTAGKKITKLYADEIRRLHSTKDLLADLTLNQPLVVAYAQAHGLLTKVCDLWPIPEPKEKKPKQETEPSKDALEDAQEAIAENPYADMESEAMPESPAEIAASIEARHRREAMSEATSESPAEMPASTEARASDVELANEASVGKSDDRPF